MNNLISIRSNAGSTSGHAIRATQMQRIAQSNKMARHAIEGEEQDMSGLTVTIGNLRDDPNEGWIYLVPKLEAMAARVGVVIQHPGGGRMSSPLYDAPGEWSLQSFFTYPAAPAEEAKP